MISTTVTVAARPSIIYTLRAVVCRERGSLNNSNTIRERLGDTEEKEEEDEDDEEN